MALLRLKRRGKKVPEAHCQTCVCDQTSEFRLTFSHIAQARCSMWPSPSSQSKLYTMSRPLAIISSEIIMFFCSVRACRSCLLFTSWQPWIRLPRRISPHNLGVRLRQRCQEDDDRWLEKANTTIKRWGFSIFLPLSSCLGLCFLCNYTAFHILRVFAQSGEAAEAPSCFSQGQTFCHCFSGRAVLLPLSHWCNCSTNKWGKSGLLAFASYRSSKQKKKWLLIGWIC